MISTTMVAPFQACGQPFAVTLPEVSLRPRLRHPNRPDRWNDEVLMELEEIEGNEGNDEEENEDANPI